MFNNFFGNNVGNNLLTDSVDGALDDNIKTLPINLGLEAFEQITGSKANAAQQKQKRLQDDKGHQRYLQDLYGDKKLTPEEIAKKEQERNAKRQQYNQIQQEISQIRAKRQQELTKQEIGQQEGTNAARNQEEKMELWQKEQKKHEEDREKQDSIVMPGSAQSRSGEQGQIMG